MRTLSLQEVESISGGIADSLVEAGIITGTVLLLAALYNSSSNKQVLYKEVAVETPYDVITPLFDAYGNHIADNIQPMIKTDYIMVPV